MGSSFETHSASTTLDDIINELQLTYDSSVGILDGEAIRAIPSLKVLHNLSTLINNLTKDLDDVENVDIQLLNKIRTKLDPNSKDEIKDDENEIYNGHDSLPELKKQNNLKRSLDDHDDNDADEETVPLAKRRKPTSQGTKIKVEDEDDQFNDDDLDSKDVIGTEKNDEPQQNDLESDMAEAKQAELNESVDDSSRVNTKDDPVPPIQQGSFTQDNDTRLKNPKSEFVSSQTLPAEAISMLGLYSEDNNGLETHGKEYLKKKFGVASYPERDLQDILPGEIPNIDFSKNKPPSNQVQFTTFQSYIESYFRPFSSDEIAFLNEKFIIPPNFEKTDYDPDVTPYLIPKLGHFYADVWAEEDGALAAKLNSATNQQPPADSYKPKGSIEALSDDKLYTEDVSCGPLSSRLLSAILSINEGDDEDEDSKDGESTTEVGVKKENTVAPSSPDGLANMKPIAEEDVASRLDTGEDYRVSSEVSDFHSIEERLKRELKFIGIFMNLPESTPTDSQTEEKQKNKMNGKASTRRVETTENGTVSIIDNDEWIKNKEDDEVCAEIRARQKELKETASQNRKCKKRLVSVAEEQIAYQEYCTILEDLDKQVDQAYMKRLKAKSKKKKHTDSTPQQQAVNNGLRVLLDKRKRWIENIGKLFPPAEVMKRVPKKSVFKGIDQSDDEDMDADDDVVNDAEALIQK